MPDAPHSNPEPRDEVWSLLWSGLGFEVAPLPIAAGEAALTPTGAVYRVGPDRVGYVEYFSEAETGTTAAVGVRTARFIETPPDPLVEGMTPLPGGHALLCSQMVYSVDSADSLAAALHAVLRKAGHPVTVMLPADSPAVDAR